MFEVLLDMIRCRLGRIDDLEAILRWLDQPAFLSGFGERGLESQSASRARHRLREAITDGRLWIAVLDNIRIAAILEPSPRSDESSCEVSLVPRLRLDWVLREDLVLDAVREVRSNEHRGGRISVNRASASTDLSKHPQVRRRLTPPAGRSALVLGPRERNRDPIALLRQMGFVVDQSMDHELAMHTVQYDLIVSSGYDRRLPKSFVSRYSDRILNLHAARLPWGRGIGTTMFSQLLQYPLGVSIHLIDDGLDTGDIIAEASVGHGDGETLRSIYGKLLTATNALFEDVLTALVDGRGSAVAQPKIPTRVFARSRADFEAVLELTPLGYDTPLHQIIALGSSMRALSAARQWLSR